MPKTARPITASINAKSRPITASMAGLKGLLKRQVMNQSSSKNIVFNPNERRTYNRRSNAMTSSTPFSPFSDSKGF